MNQKKFSAEKGFTLIELVLSIALMGFVILTAVSLLNLSSTALLNTEVETGIVRENAEFAAQLDSAIRVSGTAFTVPQRSFIEANLTAGWNYLGLMEGVNIPNYCKHNGETAADGTAMVFIEYVGDTPPANVPVNANLIHTLDGYFVQHVLAHSYTDKDGNTFEYSLVFEPTDPMQTAAQNITYHFSILQTDENGDPAGGSSDLDIESMLNTLNAMQVVYQGSPENPAVAVAFRNDFLPIYSSTVSVKPEGTIVIVLDLSGSMSTSFAGTTRVKALQQKAKDFINQLSENNRLNVCLVTFSTKCSQPANLGYSNASSMNSANADGIIAIDMCNAALNKTALLNTITKMKATGNTNVGDGLREAYYKFKNFEDAGGSVRHNFLILMTDGEMNYYSYSGSNNSNYYTGSGAAPSTGSSTAKARAYAELIGGMIMDDYEPTTTLISLCNGMSSADRAALQATFNTDDVFEVNSLTDFGDTFDMISENIENVMWAFEGPRI